MGGTLETGQLLAWTLVAIIGAMTPGIDLMIVLRSTIFHGRRAGFAAMIGVELGHAVWALASLVGLTALLAASTLAYDVIRIAGACYLVWLGCSAIWHSLPRNRTVENDLGNGTTKPAVRSAFSLARGGFLSNLLNPKVGIFYVSILPQFLPTGTNAGSWGSVLVAIALIVGLVWHSIVVLAATRARIVLSRDKVKIWLDRTSAAVMIGLGIRLATEHRV